MPFRSAFVLLLLLPVTPALPAQTPQKKLNVLFIVCDDLSNAVGCYGHPHVKTPNIDKLAKRSVMFQRAYCQYPLCNPSRTSFLSGKRPGTPEKVLAQSVFLPDFFRSLGYVVMSVGKVAHGYGPSAAHIKWDIDERPGKAPPGKSEEERTNDNRTARRAIELLKQNKDRPFFLGVGFMRPHSGHKCPAASLAKYPTAKIPLPKDREPPDHVKDIPPIALKNYAQFPAGKLADERQRHLIQYHWASTTFVDEQVGLVIDALDQLGLTDSTIIIFIGDHGFHLGEHGMFAKQSLFEESARAPLFVRAPGKKENTTSSRIVEFVDLYPTLVELCGAKAPKGLEGKSIVPLLDQPDRPWDAVAHTRVLRSNGMGKSVRTERFRYIEWGSDPQQAQLYDHDNDPREYVNLARDPRFAATVGELRKILK